MVMTTFQVKDMSCGHCVGVITKAIAAVDPQAKVEFKMDQRLVMIDAPQSDAQVLQDAIAKAGYTPIAA
jgi:copper chaperone